MGMLSDGLLLLCAALLVAAALHDAAVRTIPNALPALLLLTAIAFRLVVGGVVAGLGLGLVVFVAMFVPWSCHLIGGGDVKLAAAFAVAVPTAALATFLLAVALAGGVVALIYLVLHRLVDRPAPGRRHGLFARVRKAEAWRISRHGSIPYAAAIAAGGLFVLLPNLTPFLSK